MTEIPEIPDPTPPIPDLDIDRDRLFRTIIADFTKVYEVDEQQEELMEAYRKLFTQILDNPVIERKLWNIWKDKLLP